jgi:hypothetical protein
MPREAGSHHGGRGFATRGPQNASAGFLGPVFSHYIAPMLSRVRNSRGRPIKIKNPKAPAATRATDGTF